MDVRDFDWVSHKDYLDNCSYDDLENLQGFIKERLDRIKQEDKVTIYGVEGSACMKGWFLQYQDAYKCLCEKAVPELEDSFSCGDMIGIREKRVFESQVKDYID